MTHEIIMKDAISSVDVLVVGVHPDDSELGAGGTIAKLISEGKKVGMLDLTQGELGTRGTVEIRSREAKDSAAFLGAEWRHNLGMSDGFFEMNRENKIKIARIIRMSKPSVILANAVFDRHPDHGRAAQLVRESTFISGLEKVEIEGFDGDFLSRWRPRFLMHYIQDYNIKPDVIVDITGFSDHKIQSIQLFSSQFYNPNSKESDSPLTTPIYLDQIMGRCASWGRQIGVDYGEAFTMERTIGVNSVFDIL